MVTRIGAESAGEASFERFGAICAILTGALGLLYAVAYVALPRLFPDGGNLWVGLYSLLLMLGGIFTTAALLALYYWLRETDAAFALWGLLLGIIGAGGAIIHGGYDLANAINPPKSSTDDLPFPVDPRGLLVFGLGSLGVFIMSWLASRNARFPRNFAYLGYLLALLMVILYLGRLIILEATNPAIAIPAALTGFIVNPAWYVWLGVLLRRRA